jgi:hypothetical protein
MQQRSDSQSNLMISAMAGAFLGAAGLACKTRRWKKAQIWPWLQITAMFWPKF